MKSAESVTGPSYVAPVMPLTPHIFPTVQSLQESIRGATYLTGTPKLKTSEESKRDAASESSGKLVW